MKNKTAWEKTGSIYIHWPFCPYKCHFCPFVALASHDQYMQQYNTALIKEISNFSQMIDGKSGIETIFLGGGTPSTWPETLLLDTFGTLRKIFVINNDAEITIEVNPGTATNEKLLLWKSIGINRLSIGVQSLKDSVLNGLNRMQTKEDVFFILDQASKLFANISIDLILGLPGVSEAEWKDLLNRVVTWPINHVSIYFLTVHENTPLYFKVQKKEICLTADDAMANLYEWTINFLQQYNFVQYEISNFCKPGFESRHNQAYWKRVPFKGFGLGAWSFDGISRMQNNKNLLEYLAKVENNQDIVAFSEALDSKQIHTEKIMLALRTNEGLSLDYLYEHSSASHKEKINEFIGECIKRKLMQKTKSHIRLTASGLAMHNYLVTKLLD